MKTNIRRFGISLSVLFMMLILIGALMMQICALNIPDAVREHGVFAEEFVEEIEKQIPSDIFGGSYYDEDGNFVINVTDRNFINKIKVPYGVDRSMVKYKVVDKSLAELEKVKDTLSSYMEEYNIAVLDANDVTNMVDIQLYGENYDEVAALAYQYIEPKYVNISSVPKGSEFRFSIGKIDEMSEVVRYN